MSEMVTNESVRLPVFLPAEGAPKVAAAIIGVMHKVKDIPRTGFNKEHNYRYVEATVLTAKIQDAMVENKLVLSKREVGRAVIKGILFIRYEFDAYCDDQAIFNIGSITGACRFEFKSGAADDKSPGKVSTSAQKAYELSLFHIAADVEDIERDRPDYVAPAQATERPREREPERPRGEPGRVGERADEYLAPARARDEAYAASEDAVMGDEVDPDIKTFRASLRAALTRDAADEIWRRHEALIRSVPDPIFDLLMDDYQDRWDGPPPRPAQAAA